MNTETKKSIFSLHEAGKGYRTIALILGLPISTVKSTIKRAQAKQDQMMQTANATCLASNAAATPDTACRCKCCGATISILPGHRPREYCSDRCKMRFHRGLMLGINLISKT